MLQDPNRSSLLADDRGHLLNIEPSNCPEKNNFSLVGRETRNVSECDLGFARGNRLRLGIDGFDSVGWL